MCMYHPEHTAELVAYLPLAMGGIAALFATACTLLARPLFNRRWTNALYTIDYPDCEPSLVCPPGAAKGRFSCESGMGSYIWWKPLSWVDRMLEHVLSSRLGSGRVRGIGEPRPAVGNTSRNTYRLSLELVPRGPRSWV